MTQQVDLGEAERKVYTSRYEDGLFDVCLGVVLIATSLPDLLPPPLQQGPPRYAVYGLLCAAAFAAAWAGRRYVSAPRLGTVRLGPAGRVRQNRTRLALIGSLVFSVVLVAVTVAAPMANAGAPLFASSAQVAALVAAWMLVLFSLMAYIQGFARGYLIGALYALGLGLTEWLRDPWPAILCGVAVLLMGVGIFIRFMRNNPLPSQEGADASS